MGLPRASRGSAMHVFLVIWAQEAPLLWLFTCKKEVLIVLHLKKIKLAVNETKLSTLLARTRALVLYISISGPKSYRDFRETGPWPRQGTAFHVAVKSGQIPLWTRWYKVNITVDLRICCCCCECELAHANIALSLFVRIPDGIVWSFWNYLHPKPM